MTTITTVINPPLPTDTPAVFNTKAFEAWGDINTWAGQANTVAGEVNTNAGIATTKAGEALASANAASLSAATATTKAGEALTSANNAATSESNVVLTEKLNLGAKSSDPALDNQGYALLTGAVYYNTALNKWRVWSGTAWADGLSAVAGVSAVNGESGSLTLKTINGASLLGTGDLPVGFVVVSTSAAVTYRQNLVDTRAGAITLTLPATPADKESYQFLDAAGTFGTNSLTIARNGKSFQDTFGDTFAEDLVVDVSGVSVSVFYDGTYWRLQ